MNGFPVAFYFPNKAQKLYPSSLAILPSAFALFGKMRDIWKYHSVTFGLGNKINLLVVEMLSSPVAGQGKE